MDTNDHHDAFLGLLRWDARAVEWDGTVNIVSQGEVGVALPPEYLTDTNMQRHIQAMIRIIERDERAFRERAANELFARGGHVLFVDKDEAFDHNRFVADMILGVIAFEANFEVPEIVLGYAYDDIIEHGIDIFLTWHGSYVRVQ